jgi:class 3 adenylate cyclase
MSEIELLHDDIGGLAVHAVACVVSLARPSEVLASAITRPVAEASGVRFGPRGTHNVKGIDAPIEVYGL